MSLLWAVVFWGTGQVVEPGGVTSFTQNYINLTVSSQFYLLIGLNKQHILIYKLLKIYVKYLRTESLCEISAQKFNG